MSATWHHHQSFDINHISTYIAFSKIIHADVPGGMFEVLQFFSGCAQGGFHDAFVVDGIHAGDSADSVFGADRCGHLLHLCDFLVGDAQFPFDFIGDD